MLFSVNTETNHSLLSLSLSLESKIRRARAILFVTLLSLVLHCSTGQLPFPLFIRRSSQIKSVPSLFIVVKLSFSLVRSRSRLSLMLLS